MVTDLIKIPCVKNFVFRDHLQTYPDSILNVTLHNVIITHKESDGSYKERWVREIDCHWISILFVRAFVDILYKYGCDSTTISNEN